MHKNQAHKEKQSWRTLLKEKREAISLERRLEATDLAYQELTPLFITAQYVLSYASFGSELCLSKVNQWLMHEKKLVLPSLNENRVLLYQVDSFEKCEKHTWGFLQPDPLKCPLIIASKVDLVLVPGLGFDLKSKGRIGYGKGHYDRLLAHLKSAEFLGVGFKEQQVKNLPQETHDVPMHKIYLF